MDALDEAVAPGRAESHLSSVESLIAYVLGPGSRLLSYPAELTRT